MQTTHSPNDYARWIAALARKLPAERAAQLYDFARFLLNESGEVIGEDTSNEVTETELEAEDAVWDAALARHADEFAKLKAQAREDVEAGKSLPMFDERGEYQAE